MFTWASAYAGEVDVLTRIAIVSAPGSELQKIHSAFRNPVKFTVREFLSMDSVVNELISFPAEILLVRVPVFEERHVKMIQKARRRFHDSSIMLLAAEIRPSARLASAKIERFKLLQEPMEVSDLPALAEKLVRGQNSAQRLHPRARREGSVSIIDKDGLVYRGTFLDFAQMGARLIIPSLKSFGARDSVQIVYSSSHEPGRQHRLEAKIVWCNLAGGLANQLMGVRNHIAGIRFIAQY